jgi:hypothetical protein
VPTLNHVLVGHAASRAVRHHAESLGTSRHDTIERFLDHDIRDVMTHRVCVAERESGLANFFYTPEFAETEVRDVV